MLAAEKTSSISALVITGKASFGGNGPPEIGPWRLNYTTLSPVYDHYIPLRYIPYPQGNVGKILYFIGKKYLFNVYFILLDIVRSNTHNSFGKIVF